MVLIAAHLNLFLLEGKNNGSVLKVFHLKRRNVSQILLLKIYGLSERRLKRLISEGLLKCLLGWKGPTSNLILSHQICSLRECRNFELNRVWNLLLMNHDWLRAIYSLRSCWLELRLVLRIYENLRNELLVLIRKRRALLQRLSTEHRSRALQRLSMFTSLRRWKWGRDIKYAREYHSVHYRLIHTLILDLNVIDQLVL